MGRNSATPEYNLLKDAYLGSSEVLQSKLNFLRRMAQEENWDYHAGQM